MSHYGIMAITSSLLWNHAPSYSSVELLPTKLNLYHPLLSISPDVYFVSQLKRCSNVSLHELILHCSIFEKIVSCRVSFPLHRVGWRSRKQRCQDRLELSINILEKDIWIVKNVLACVPLSSYLTTWISGRDSCLVGVSCHIPRSDLH